MIVKVLLTRLQKGWKLGVLWLLSALPVGVSCTDTGVLVAIEDAKELSDGNLSNYIFAHSLVQIESTIYVGSKFVWKKTSSNGRWSKINLPSSLDPNETPVVSIATDDTNLFLASSKKIYVRVSNNWSSVVLDRPSVGFSFYALRGLADKVLAVDLNNSIYQYSAEGGWEELLNDTKMNDLAKINDTYYLASGSKLKTGKILKSLGDMSDTPNGSDEITNLLSVNLNGVDYLCMLAAGKLYTYARSKWSSKSTKDDINIVLGQVNDELIVGRLGAGYRIYDIANSTWKGDKYYDDFTDRKSLVTLSSGASIINLSLGLFLFYDDTSDDNNDRIYATTQSSDGVFSAKRKGLLWSWGLE